MRENQNSKFDICLTATLGNKAQILLLDRQSKHCGIDYSKAALIADDSYIDNSNVPHIRNEEFEALRGKDYIVKTGFESYIIKYAKALLRLDIKRNADLCKYSTLQYFHEELGL